MNSSSRTALVFSAVLHALLLGLVVLFAWRSTSRADADNLLVMEVFAPPGEHEENSFTAPPADAPLSEPPPEPAPAAQEVPDAQPMLNQLDIAPVAEQVFEELRDVPPAPEPEPEPPAEPIPSAPPPPVPTPKPAPKPAEKTTADPPKPKVMTAAEFQRTMGMPKKARDTSQRPAPNTATRGTGRAPVKIDTSNITRSLEGLLPSGNSARVAQMSSSDQNALLAYLGRLRVNIRKAWVLPDIQSGKAEWAEVLVTIEPNGRVSDVRIGKHDGSKAFLDSITRAVRLARSVGPTPSGQREYARYTLNLREM